MKTFIALALFSFSALAADFECVYSLNLKEIYRNNVSIADGAKAVVIADFEDYRFFMTSAGDNKYELQALIVSLPTRIYASSRISANNPELDLVFWSRDEILEGKCTLK